MLFSFERTAETLGGGVASAYLGMWPQAATCNLSTARGKAARSNIRQARHKRAAKFTERGSIPWPLGHPGDRPLSR